MPAKKGGKKADKKPVKPKTTTPAASDKSQMTTEEKINALHYRTRDKVLEASIKIMETQGISGQEANKKALELHEEMNRLSSLKEADKAKKKADTARLFATEQHREVAAFRSKNNLQIASELKKMKVAEDKIDNARDALKQAEDKLLSERARMQQLREEGTIRAQADLNRMDLHMEALQQEVGTALINMAHTELEAENLRAQARHMGNELQDLGRTAEEARVLRERLEEEVFNRDLDREEAREVRERLSGDIFNRGFEGEREINNMRRIIGEQDRDIYEAETELNRLRNRQTRDVGIQATNMVQELEDFIRDALAPEQERVTQIDPEFIPAVAGALLSGGMAAVSGGAGPAPPIINAIAAGGADIAAGVGTGAVDIAAGIGTGIINAAGAALRTPGMVEVTPGFVAQNINNAITAHNAVPATVPNYPIYSEILRIASKKIREFNEAELGFRSRTLASLARFIEHVFTDYPIARSTELYIRHNPKAAFGAGSALLLSGNLLYRKIFYKDANSEAIKKSLNNALQLIGTSFIGHNLGIPPTYNAIASGAIYFIPSVNDYRDYLMNEAFNYFNLNENKTQHERLPNPLGYAGQFEVKTHKEGTSTVITDRGDYDKNPNTVQHTTGKTNNPYDNPPANFQGGRTFGPKIASPIGGPTDAVPSAKPPGYYNQTGRVGQPLDDKYFDQISAYRQVQERQYASKGAYGPYFPSTLTSAQDQQVKNSINAAKPTRGAKRVNTLADLTLPSDMSAPGVERKSQAWNVGIHRGAKGQVDVQGVIAMKRRAALEGIKKAINDANTVKEAARLRRKYNMSQDELFKMATSNLLDYFNRKDKVSANRAAEMFIALNYDQYKDIIDNEIMNKNILYPQYTRPIINKSQYF